MKKVRIAPCKQCGKETYNQTKEWMGYCSAKCKRITTLENKALSECWTYCYENGLTTEEQKEYDKLVGY